MVTLNNFKAADEANTTRIRITSASPYIYPRAVVRMAWCVSTLLLHLPCSRAQFRVRAAESLVRPRPLKKREKNLFLKFINSQTLFSK